MIHKHIYSIEEIHTEYSEWIQAYEIPLSDGYSLSILTGSHDSSATEGTLEIALLLHGDYAIQDDDYLDPSIIHFISKDEAISMLKEMQDTKKYINTFISYRDK